MYKVLCVLFLMVLVSCGSNTQDNGKNERRQYLENLPPKEQIKVLFGDDTTSPSYGRALRLLERDGNLHRLNEYIHY